MKAILSTLSRQSSNDESGVTWQHTFPSCWASDLELIVKRSQGPTKPFTQLAGKRREGSYVITETIDGCPLGQLIGRQCLSIQIALELASHVHEVLNRAKRLHLRIPSLHPENLFCSKLQAEQDLTSWLASQRRPILRIRTIPTRLPHSRQLPDLMDKAIQQSVGQVSKEGFQALVARLIGHQGLRDDRVLQILREFATIPGLDSEGRRSFLSTLDQVRRSASSGSACSIVKMPLDPEVRDRFMNGKAASSCLSYL